jgi:Cu-processing system ATP-binding protein
VVDVSPAVAAGLVVARDATIGIVSRSSPRTLFTCTGAITPGRIIALVGVNGAGKSTFLRTLAGFSPLVSGTLTVGGLSPSEYRATHGIGILPESFALPREATGWELLDLSHLAATTGGRHTTPPSDAIDAAIAAAGVDFPLDQAVHRLSNGMRQRLALAMALVPKPQLVLLDEPESGLDPTQRVALRERLRAMALAGTTLIISSHDVSGIGLVADEMWLVDDGRVTIITLHGDRSLEALYAQLPPAWRA